MTEPDLPDDRTRAREQLSSLMDGDSSSDTVALACRHWKQDTDARAQWHAYHLIGDVLRSEDLCRRSGADAEFLQSVRARLAQEPVVLAPTVVPQSATLDAAVGDTRAIRATAPTTTTSGLGGGGTRRSRFHLRRWVAPVGMAAGVALVAGAVLVTRPGDGSGGQSPMAINRMDATRAPAGLKSVSPDNELVRYLDAHQQFPGTPALGPAPGFMRSAAYEPMPSR